MNLQEIRNVQIRAAEDAVTASLPPELRVPAALETIKADMVNHPPHYTAGKVECIDALEAATTGLTGIDAVCTAAAIKYLWRWKQKGGSEDLKKARWYIDHMLGVGA